MQPNGLGITLAVAYIKSPQGSLKGGSDLTSTPSGCSWQQELEAHRHPPLRRSAPDQQLASGQTSSSVVSS